MSGPKRRQIILGAAALPLVAAGCAGPAVTKMKAADFGTADLGLRQVAEFTEAGASAEFGATVAASAGTVLVGDPGSNTVLAYRRGAGGWRRQRISGPSGADGFGHAVATGPAGDVIGAWRRRQTETGSVFRLEGARPNKLAGPEDGAIVGHAVASGQGGIAYAERRGTDGRVVLQTAAGTTSLTLPADQSAHFGASLAASGDRLAVLAPGAERGGAVRVYDMRTGDLAQRLAAPSGGVSASDRLAMDGTHVLRTGPMPRRDRPVLLWRDGQAQALDLTVNRAAATSGRGFLMLQVAPGGLFDASDAGPIQVVDLTRGTVLSQVDPGAGAPVGIGAGDGTVAIVWQAPDGGATLRIFEIG